MADRVYAPYRSYETPQVRVSLGDGPTSPPRPVAVPHMGRPARLCVTGPSLFLGHPWAQARVLSCCRTARAAASEEAGFWPVIRLPSTTI